jgi:chaperonin GroES
MATNIDKALYQQPQGIADAAEQEEPIEIEIIDPEEVNIHAGDLELSIRPGEDEDEFGANLADELDPGELSKLAGELAEDITNDLGSRSEWEKSYVQGLKLLGLQYEERTEPWDGACGVFHPMITEAVVRFQSESITETFPAQGPVKTKIIGQQTPEKNEAADRVQDDMNYELTEVMREFRPEHERMLWSLPATGSAFKKVYFDPGLGRQVSMFIPAEDIILPYGATDLDTCYRVTHTLRKTKSEIIKLQQAGFYRDIELPDPDKSKTDIQQAKDKETGFSDLNDDRYTLYESHVDLVIKGDKHTQCDEDGQPLGVTLPYVMTIIKGTNDVLALRRNWKEDDKLCLKRQHFVHYQYIPGFGAYGFGLFHLIGGYAKSATSIMRQLVDAGTLSNLPGGLKTRGLRIKGDDTPIAPGEFRDVDIGSGALRDNILPLPYKEPSSVLAALMDKIVEEGRRFAATADMKVSDMSAQAPVGTTLALLERQLKVMTAVSARLHFSFKQELKLLAGLIRDYTDADYDYDPVDAPRKAKKGDYSHVEIIPVSDPNAATMSQRVVQYQAVIQMAQMAPDIYDLPKLHRGMLEVLGIKNAAELVPLEDDQKPKDPVSENMAALKGEPLKAFMYQDHESHIKVHTSAMQDPIIMQLVGQNPKAPQIQAAMMAHIAEHVGFAYRQKIEQRLGMPLPPQDEKLPPEIELQLSAMMAEAAQQVLQQSQSMAAQQQAQQQAQDPLVQMQQQELQIRAQEVQIKMQEAQLKEKQMAIEAAAKADELALKREELTTRMQLEGTKVAAKMRYDTERLAAEQQRDGARMGVDIAKSRDQIANQKQQYLAQLAKNKGKTTK